MLNIGVGTLSEEALYFLLGNYALRVVLFLFFSKIPGNGQTFPDIGLM